MKRLTRHCLVCGNQFVVEGNEDDYCSLKCASGIIPSGTAVYLRIWKRDKRNKVIKKWKKIKRCLECGNKFLTQLPKHVFCSKSCYSKVYWRAKGTDVGIIGTHIKCSHCGLDGIIRGAGQKYCSNKCFRAAEYLRHRERKMILVTNRKALKLKLGGSFTLEEWEELKRQHGFRCALCHLRKKLTKDHVIPLSRWAEWIKSHPEVRYRCGDIENIQPLCAKCNNHKRSKLIPSD